MEITTPVSKSDMYRILGEIFYYYRIRRDPYDEFVLPELTLERMQITLLSEEELTEKARELLASKQKREYLNYKKEIEEKIKKLDTLKALEEIARVEQINSYNSLHSATKENLIKEAQKNGLNGSSVIVRKLTDIEEEKNNKIVYINYESAKKQAEYQAQIEELTLKLNSIDNYFSEIFSLEVAEKVEELKRKQEEDEREVFKYNNSIEEKCQRYKGTVASTNASLKLKYLQINSDAFSKEELLEMGYYRDVVDCVCLYYNTLNPREAYLDIVNEQQLIVYLDDYYQNIVYMYEAKSNQQA